MRENISVKAFGVAVYACCFVLHISVRIQFVSAVLAVKHSFIAADDRIFNSVSAIARIVYGIVLVVYKQKRNLRFAD